MAAEQARICMAEVYYVNQVQIMIFVLDKNAKF
jgi:hypothetical protein